MLSTALLLSAHLYTVKPQGPDEQSRLQGVQATKKENQKIHVFSKVVAAIYLDFTVIYWERSLLLPLINSDDLMAVHLSRIF